MVLACDFETTNSVEDCRIWSYGAYLVPDDMECFDDRLYWCGTTMDGFISLLRSFHCDITIVFHNTGFDFSFIEYYLCRSGYRWVNSKKLGSKQYTSLVSDMGVFYTAKFSLGGRIITVLDSAKLVHDKLKNFPKLFGLPNISKGEIDYNKYRPLGYEPTEEEKDYQFRDCKILAMGYRHLLDMGYRKLTIASNTLAFYKEQQPLFRQLFPLLEPDADDFCRKAYKGAICIVNTRYENVIVGEGRVYDVNSLYPFHNCYSPLPYGQPEYYEGSYRYDKNKKLYIQRIVVDCHLKQGHMPCIMLKSGFRHTKNTYLTDTEGEQIELILTSVDLAILKEHYIIEYIEYIDGYKFRASNTMFRDFFESLFEQKETAAVEGNLSRRTDAKLKMNSLGGKFGSRTRTKRKIPIYDGSEDKIHYDYEEEKVKPVYVPVIAFVLAWARKQVVQAMHENIDRFLYCDTDSLHLLGDCDPVGMEIDKVKIGAWDYELHFSKARYIRQKTYIEIDYETGRSHVKCAGLPSSEEYTNVLVEDFKPGWKATGLKAKNVPGGKVLVETEFSLK